MSVVEIGFVEAGEQPVAVDEPMARSAVEEEQVLLAPCNRLGDDEIVRFETPPGLASRVLVPNGN